MEAGEEIETPSSSIYITQEWSDATDSIVTNSNSSKPPIVFICGPNKCGKTTFSLYLVSVLLQRHKKVAYLDTDVGQTVFSPPGILSLTMIDKIAPDLALPSLKTPERCFFFGDTSSKADPNLYKSCIFNLFDDYQKEYSVNNQKFWQRDPGLPLVINTPGWVKGMGYDLLVDMINYMSPTHVVKIQMSIGVQKNLPAGAFWISEGIMDTCHLIEMNAAVQERSVLKRKDASSLRDSRVRQYFKQIFPIDMDLRGKKLGLALAAHPPYEVLFSSVEVKHLHCKVAESEIFYSLNATIVGLAISSEDPENLPRCVGLGIVRAIDASIDMLYVLTPVAPEILEDVDLLLQGFIQIPTSILKAGSVVSPYVSRYVLPYS